MQKINKFRPSTLLQLPQNLKWTLGVCCALLSAILLGSAYGKLFHPSEELIWLDFGASLLELGVIFALLRYQIQPQLWGGLALLFAAWGGYSLYWLRLELPCKCMGDMIEFPTYLSFSLDVTFFVFSLAFATLLGAKRHTVYLQAIAGFFLALVGFASGEWVFEHLLMEF